MNIFSIILCFFFVEALFAQCYEIKVYNSNDNKNDVAYSSRLEFREDSFYMHWNYKTAEGIIKGTWTKYKKKFSLSNVHTDCIVESTLFDKNRRDSAITITMIDKDSLPLAFAGIKVNDSIRLICNDNGLAYLPIHVKNINSIELGHIYAYMPMYYLKNKIANHYTIQVSCISPFEYLCLEQVNIRGGKRKIIFNVPFLLEKKLVFKKVRKKAQLLSGN